MFLKGTGQILTKKIFVLDHFDIDWPNILKLEEENVNSATSNFLDAINSVLNKYAPLKKLNKYKFRLKKTLGLLLVFKNQSIFKTNY